MVCYKIYFLKHKYFIDHSRLLHLQTRQVLYCFWSQIYQTTVLNIILYFWNLKQCQQQLFCKLRPRELGKHTEDLDYLHIQLPDTPFDVNLKDSFLKNIMRPTVQIPNSFERKEIFFQQDFLHFMLPLQEFFL